MNMIAMWKWINRTVFGHEAPDMIEKKLSDIEITEDQLRILCQIESVAAWLAGISEAIETGSAPDVVLKRACREGAKQLRDIEKSMEKG